MALADSFGEAAIAGDATAQFGIGVSSIARGEGGIAVWARAFSPATTAVLAVGNLSASGVKSFRIDHPRDPENDYLLHYSAEGPEPLNVYSGIIRTDEHGEAWVQLPPYFEDVNRDFRYTLTVVDDSDSPDFVHVKVAREIRNNRFKIRSSAVHVKVSWEVKGVRNDAWMRAHGAPVESRKRPEERGKYLHPELYGKSQDFAINVGKMRAAEAAQDEPVAPP